MISVERAELREAREVVKRSDCAGIPGVDRRLRDILYRSTDRFIAYADKQPAVMWGLIPQTLLSNQAYMWMLTTEIATEHRFLLVRYSQLYVERALQSYELIVGHIPTGKPDTKRWLRWLGAEFGPSDGKEITFAIRRK